LKDLPHILASLEAVPDVLRNILDDIPESELKKQRIPGKWSIHEHACHLADVQPMLIRSLETLRDDENPMIKPFLPGINETTDHLIKMNLAESIEQFSKYRKIFLKIAEQFPQEMWHKEASHPEYKTYTPYILLRHVLMHDYFHTYRIEQLWLTTEEHL